MHFFITHHFFRANKKFDFTCIIQKCIIYCTTPSSLNIYMQYKYRTNVNKTYIMKKFIKSVKKGNSLESIPY